MSKPNTTMDLEDGYLKTIYKGGGEGVELEFDDYGSLD